MKNLITSTILLLALLLPAVATAADIEVDGIYYNINRINATATVTFGNNEYKGSVTIPATVTHDGTTYAVTTIGELAFSRCIYLTDINIPNSVTYIGYGAFSRCKSLTEISIPNSVSTIDDDVFSECSFLTTINIPNSVTTIGDRAFSGTGWYSNQPDGLVYAGLVAYKYKGTMPPGTSITLKEGTLSISGYAFADCSGLTSIVIPNSVTYIGDWTFAYCESLTSIDIPKSVTKIGEDAFYDTPWFNNQPDGLVYAGTVAYQYKGTMPSGTNITLRNGTTSITGDAFRYCTGLTSIVIPNSVDSIAGEAFAGCKGLTSIVIPNSVTGIDSKAFDWCSGLTSIVVESGNPRYDSHNGCNAIIETASNTLIAGCKNTIIPNSVTKIGDYAFSGRTGLTDIVIPNSVTAIGFMAFKGCRGLTSIDIPNSVTKIGIHAFGNCTGLTSIVIPNSITEISDNTFSGCTGLTSIVIPNSVIKIGQQAFGGCTGLSSIVIPNSVTRIDFKAFEWCTGLSDVYSYIADPLRVSNEYGDPCCWWYLYDGDYSGRTLHVLQGMTGAYQADERWHPYFGQIVEDIFMGDVNRDLEVNIADVNAVIDIILGGNDDTIAADVNGDGEINIADINAVIDIILNGTRN